MTQSVADNLSRILNPKDKMRILLAAWAVLTGVAASGLAAEPAFLWIEGENATRSQANHNAWFDAVDALELSGGAQIGNFSEPEQAAGWAEYDVTAPTAGAYHFWLRANPCTGLLFKVDRGAWTKVDPQAMEQEDQANRRKEGYVAKARQFFNVAADGRHDARTMTWYYVGSARPDPGPAHGPLQPRRRRGGRQAVCRDRLLRIDHGPLRAQLSSTSRARSPRTWCR